MAKRKAAKKKGKGKSRDVITEALLLGFGLMDVSREKMEKAVKELKKDRNITKSESRKAVDDFMDKVSDSREDMQEMLRKHVRNIVDEMGIATKKERKTKKRRKK